MIMELELVYSVKKVLAKGATCSFWFSKQYNKNQGQKLCNLDK